MHRIISVLSKNGKIEEESFLERFVRSSKVSRISCCVPVSLKRISVQTSLHLYHIITRYFPNFIPPTEGRQILSRVSSFFSSSTTFMNTMIFWLERIVFEYHSNCKVNRFLFPLYGRCKPLCLASIIERVTKFLILSNILRIFFPIFFSAISIDVTQILRYEINLYHFLENIRINIRSTSPFKNLFIV